MAVEDCKLKRGGGAIALYPLAGYRDEVKPLRGKRVHAIIVAEE